MIRKLQKEDLIAVGSLWLKGNVQSHYFVDETYWNSQFDNVKGQLLQSEVYVYVDKYDEIVGFVGLVDNYIAGIFIDSAKRSRGVGKQLLDYCKASNLKLTLNVYQKNQRALHFYQREGFVIKEETVDENTDEKEFFMTWKK